MSRGVPPALRAVLPRDVAETWVALAPVLPASLYLGGGTAVAVHLHHRQSRDLDFFFHARSVDLVELAAMLGELGRFALTHEGSDTLRGLFGTTKLEFFHADEIKPQQLLEEPRRVAGLPVAGLKDLAAMKLKVLGDRGELRDYFDLQALETRGGLSVEDGIAYFVERYNIGPQSDALQHIVRALGYLDDIEPDDALPVTKAELADWWGRRQARLVLNLARNPL